MAGGHLSELHRSLEQTLQQAERQRLALEESREAAEREAALAAEARRSAAAERERAAAEARAEIATARRSAEEILATARRAVRAAEEARARSSQRSLVEDARRALAEAEEARRSAESAPPTAPPPTALRPGDAVLVRGSPEPAELLAIDDRGNAEVQAGSARLRVSVTDLRAAPTSTAEPVPTTSVPRASNVPLQLDLRGARAEDALLALERYLNDAALAGYERVRIVHGKGTGALRQAVRAYLAQHAIARRVEPATARDGGDGATIVVL